MGPPNAEQAHITSCELLWFCFLRYDAQIPLDQVGWEVCTEIFTFSHKHIFSASRQGHSLSQSWFAFFYHSSEVVLHYHYYYYYLHSLPGKTLESSVSLLFLFHLDNQGNLAYQNNPEFSSFIVASLKNN